MANWDDVRIQAAGTRKNISGAAGTVADAAFNMASGAKNKAATGVEGMAKAGSRVASNGASILLSATDGLANMAKKYPAVTAVLAAATAISGLSALWKGHKNKTEAQKAEEYDLRERIAANRAARVELVAGKDGGGGGLGEINPNNTGHAAATGRGIGVGQSA